MIKSHFDYRICGDDATTKPVQIGPLFRYRTQD